MVRVVADACCPGVPSDNAKQRLMRGVCELLDADAWLWRVARVDGRSTKPIGLCVLHEGWTPRQYAAMLQDAEPGSGKSVIDRAMIDLIRTGDVFAKPRQDIIDDEPWYADASVERCYLDHGMDHTLFCGYPLNGSDLVSVQSFYRAIGKPAYSLRDQRIAHTVIAEIGWLHRVGLPEDDGKGAQDLSPRLRSVLVLLLEGRSRNEIAELLSLSPHTVKDYIQAVYRHFEVTSQAKLIHQYRVSDAAMNHVDGQ